MELKLRLGNLGFSSFLCVWYLSAMQGEPIEFYRVTIVDRKASKRAD